MQNSHNKINRPSGSSKHIAKGLASSLAHFTSQVCGLPASQWQRDTQKTWDQWLTHLCLTTSAFQTTLLVPKSSQYNSSEVPYLHNTLKRLQTLKRFSFPYRWYIIVMVSSTVTVPLLSSSNIINCTILNRPLGSSPSQKKVYDTKLYKGSY